MNSNELWKQNVCNISMNLRCEFGLCRWDWIWYFDIPNETFLGLILENRKLTRTNCGNRVSRSINLRCEFGLCRWDWIWYFDFPNSSYYCTICTPWKYWLHSKYQMIQRTRCKQTFFLSCQPISSEEVTKKKLFLGWMINYCGRVMKMRKFFCWLLCDQILARRHKNESRGPTGVLLSEGRI